MRTFLFLFVSLVVSFSAFSQSKSVSIQGLILKTSETVYLRDSNSSTYYELHGATADTLRLMTKLQSGDIISGYGEVVGTRFSLISVDFVGLKKVLGLWVAARDGLLEFLSYNRLLARADLFQKGNGSPDDISIGHKVYLYSISPYQGDKWAMFISDENETLMGTLNLTDERALMTLLDSKTGQVRKSIRLDKALDY